MRATSDDTFVVGDLNAVGYVKLTRQGAPLWHFLGSCDGAPGSKCAEGDLVGNHGHHLLDDGSFLFFKAGFSVYPAYEYHLSEGDDSLSASETWSYDPGEASSMVLGDIQRLPNGNTLIVYSTDGEMRELSPEGDTVQTLLANGRVTFGYATFRETLYGPPPR